MTQLSITDKALELAQVCLNCPVGSRTRDRQQGLTFWSVKVEEGSLCPSCQAYTRAYGPQTRTPLRGA